MRAAEVMNPNPDSLRPTDTLELAASIIMQSRYRSLPVIDDSGCYLGMFDVNCLLKHVIPKAVFLPQGLSNVSFIHESFADLYERYAQVRGEKVTICLRNDIKPLHPDTPLTETLLQLYNSHLSMPVVSEGECKLLGMISYFDVGQKILDVGR